MYSSIIKLSKLIIDFILSTFNIFRPIKLILPIFFSYLLKVFKSKKWLGIFHISYYQLNKYLKLTKVKIFMD